MPGRNILKQDVPESYYHVYARGANKQPIFLETADYAFFLSLLKRHLSIEPIANARGVGYVNFHDDIQLLSYCLMSNHFHLMFYQIKPGAMPSLMRRIMGCYSTYFNRKYDRRGALFESRYRASRITSDEYLLHISRYIHLNPEKWRTYDFSSVHYYLGNTSPDWVTTEPIKELFGTPSHYLTFLEDYEQYRLVLKQFKHELANFE